jgi:hypothetical protein
MSAKNVLGSPFPSSLPVDVTQGANWHRPAMHRHSDPARLGRMFELAMGSSLSRRNPAVGFEPPNHVGRRLVPFWHQCVLYTSIRQNAKGAGIGGTDRNSRRKETNAIIGLTFGKIDFGLPFGAF